MTGPAPRHRGADDAQEEIDRDRRAEWWLVPKAALALAVVAALVVLGRVFTG